MKNITPVDYSLDDPYVEPLHGWRLIVAWGGLWCAGAAFLFGVAVGLYNLVALLPAVFATMTGQW